MSGPSLTFEERYQFYEYQLAGFTMTEIAGLMRRHRSVLYDERARCAPGSYCPVAAQAHRDATKAKSAANGPRKSNRVVNAVKVNLGKDWSPEQISGRFKLLEREGMSTQGIYDLVKREDLSHQLRRWKAPEEGKRWPTRRPYSGSAKSIHTRDKSVMDRLDMGHWETDTVTGRQRDRKRIIASHERQSLFAVLRLVDGIAAKKVARCVKRDLKDSGLPFKTVTSDRGAEFAHLGDMMPDEAYVCDPNAPNQRGTNENQIGPLRQYAPKGKTMVHLTQKQVKKMQDKLNHRPRKCLGYLTPHEVMFKCYPSVGSRA